MDKKKALAIFGEIMLTDEYFLESVELTRENDSDKYLLHIKGKNLSMINIENIAQTHHLKVEERNGIIVC